MAQTKVKRTASRDPAKRQKASSLSEAMKLFPRDPGAEARRLARKREAKKS